MRCFLSLTSGLLLLAGCPFDPEPPDALEDDSMETSSGGDTTPTGSGPTSLTSATDATDPSSTTDDPPSTTDDPSDTEDASCGNG